MNSTATKTFFACVEQNVEKVIFASSAAVYGSSHEEIKKIGEEGSPNLPMPTPSFMGKKLHETYLWEILVSSVYVFSMSMVLSRKWMGHTPQ